MAQTTLDKIDGICSAWFRLNCDKRILQNIMFRFESEHQHEPDSRRLAVMNIVGYIYHELNVKGILGSASQCFERVLSEDPDNLNALKSLVHIHRPASPEKEFKYQRHLDRLWQCDRVLQEQLIARCMFEHAVYMSVREESFLRDNHQQIIETFEKCIRIGKESKVTKCELELWRYELGILYVRLDSLSTKEPKLTQVTERQWLVKSLETLYEVATSGSCERQRADCSLHNEFLDCKGKSWSYLGVALMRRLETQGFAIKDVAQSIGGEFCTLNGIQCFEKALSISPNQPSVLRRVGQAYMRTGEMDKAKEYLWKSVKIQPTGYAYSLLGQWYFKNYQMKESKDDLDSSIKYLNLARKGSCDMYTMFKCLIQAYKASGNLEEAKKYCETCAGTFEGSREADLFRLWAKLLRETKNIAIAEQKEQRAKKISDGQNPEEIKDFGVHYAKSDEERVERFVKQVEGTMEVSGYYLGRDLTPGNYFIDGLIGLEKKCKYVFVFCTENYDSRFENELNKIMHRRLEREHGSVIPLVFGNARVPECIADVKGINYDESQQCFDELEEVFHGKKSLRRRIVHIMRGTNHPMTFVRCVTLAMAFLVGRVTTWISEYVTSGKEWSRHVLFGLISVTFLTGMLIMGLVDKFRPYGMHRTVVQYVILVIIAYFAGLNGHFLNSHYGRN